MRVVPVWADFAWDCVLLVVLVGWVLACALSAIVLVWLLGVDMAEGCAVCAVIFIPLLSFGGYSLWASLVAV